MNHKNLKFYRKQPYYKMHFFKVTEQNNNCDDNNKIHCSQKRPGALTGCSAIEPLASTPLLCIAYSCNSIFSHQLPVPFFYTQCYYI